MNKGEILLQAKENHLCQGLKVDKSRVAQMVKNLPAIQEAHIQSLGQEDPLEKGMATHSSNLAWEISWTEEVGGRLQSMGSQKTQTQCSY